MHFKSLILSITLILLSATPVSAVSNPLDSPNNFFGIHVIDENDLDLASQLVNSSGGDWGYITLVIREDNRHLDQWQATFDRMRQLHLIPILRLATTYQDNSWTPPRLEDLEPWIDFLNSLNWVITNRYIILFNEPNHAKEWGGTIDPVQYATITRAYTNALKQASSDFFILPAGLDLSAPTTTHTMSPTDFYSLIHQADPDFFTLFDGWTSHSYPNPNFSASPWNSGPNSIRGYLWENQLLTSYGLPSNTPIFITETGWAHNLTHTEYPLTPNSVAKYFSTAFTQVWNQPNIVAVTPFILNYTTPPFSQFSLLDPTTHQPLLPYSAIQNLPKTTASPAQIQDSLISNRFFPTHLISDTPIKVATEFTNIGQSIWNSTAYTLLVDSSLPSDSFVIHPVPSTRPFQTATIWIKFTPPPQPGDHHITYTLSYQGQPFGDSITQQFTITPPTNLSAQIRLFIERLLHHHLFSLPPRNSLFSTMNFS